MLHADMRLPIIFLSPHLGDAVLSCGGMIYQLAQAGQAVQVITILAGDPSPAPLSPFAQSLRDRWQADPAARRGEDVKALTLLGAEAIQVVCTQRLSGARCNGWTTDKRMVCPRYAHPFMGRSAAPHVSVARSIRCGVCVTASPGAPVWLTSFTCTLQVSPLSRAFRVCYNLLQRMRGTAESLN